MIGESISKRDRDVLRGLAARQMEYAASTRNQETVSLWHRHNACQGERPVVVLELRTFESEVIPQRLKCEGETARIIETDIYRNILNYEIFEDDKAVPDYFPITWKVSLQPFGIEVGRTHAENTDGNTLGHKFIYKIGDLEEDFDKLGNGRISLNREETIAWFDLINELFGDILPAKMVSNCLYCVPSQDLVHIMGMENMYFAMYDYPELFHKAMRRYTDDVINYYRFLERENLLLPTTGNETLGNGTFCFSNELPGLDALEGRNLVSTDLWGFMDSQETVGISPDAYKEFFFPYYSEIMAQYGLVSYGCCEPVHPIWDSCLAHVPNIRKVSISPWCDEAIMADRLRGRKTIFHRKPSPNYLGVGETLDEAAFREHIRNSIKTAKGLTMEITQRDVYTINNDEAKARRFVQIIREEIVNNW